MSGFLIDSNVLLDIATADSTWMQWSAGNLGAASKLGSIFINPIIYAEIAPAFAFETELEHWLDPGVFRRTSLPYAAGWLAAQAFLTYRRGGGARTAPLPDFYIGAHAQVEKLTLITRDAARYRTYFPDVALICP